MKNKLKLQLRTLLADTLVQIDAAFSTDPSISSNPHLVAVRRLFRGEWQFVALSFSTQTDRFFLEVALSRKEEFPASTVPAGAYFRFPTGELRFRAAELWGQNKSGGWLISKPGEPLPSDLLMCPEGIFQTPEAALGDVKQRVIKWVIPYLDSTGIT